MSNKLTIVTVCFNSASTIRRCIESVQSQTYRNIEHVIVDGASTDATTCIVKSLLTDETIFISEHDSGIYDALNKGFKISTGDIIGILHSDDIFHDSTVITRVVSAFADQSVDYVYGDIEVVREDGKVIRYWRPGVFKDGLITKGQIPHPALFLHRRLFRLLDPVFDNSYMISADLKQQLIFANIYRSKGLYLHDPLVKMRVGGKSTKNLSAYIHGWKESRRAWNEVHGSGGVFFVLKKVFSKIPGLRF